VSTRLSTSANDRIAVDACKESKIQEFGKKSMYAVYTVKRLS